MIAQPTNIIKTIMVSPDTQMEAGIRMLINHSLQKGT